MLDALAHPDETTMYAHAEYLAFRAIARAYARFERLAHLEDLRVDARAPLSETVVRSIGNASDAWVSETVRAIKLRVKGRA